MVKEKCQNDCSECAQIQQRIFEREVDEELQQEKLRALWKKYHFVVYGMVLAILTGTIGTELYHSWKIKTERAESDRYENAVVMAYQGDVKTAEEKLKQLSEDGKTGYRYLASLERATLLMSEGNEAEALGILNQMADSKQAPKPIRDAAVLSFVGNQLDTGNTVELQGYLAPLMADANSPYYGEASELSALLHILSGEKEQALQKLQAVASNPKSSENLKMRANTLIGCLKK